jgi:hypothetical protein
LEIDVVGICDFISFDHSRTTVFILSRNTTA